MISWRSLIICVLLLSACSQIEVPKEPSRKGPSTTQKTGTSSSTSSASSNSNLKRYNESYNLFKVEHRDIFRQIEGNKLALRSAGNQTVEAVEQMYALLTPATQSRVEDIRDGYIDAWDNFDPRSPSTGERTRLKRAGKRVIREFNPSSVQVRKPSSKEKNRKNTTDEAESTKRVRQEKIIIRQQTDDQKIRVENPERYRRLFQNWRDLHDKFQNGLESSDPLIPSTYESLVKTIKKMIEEVGNDRDKLSYYYLSQYQLIYDKREQFRGTPKKSNHLEFLKKQFINDFAPGTSN